MTHLGVRTDDEWDQDMADAIKRAWDTGEVVVGSRDLPEDDPPPILERMAVREHRKVSKWGQWIGRLIKR